MYIYIYKYVFESLMKVYGTPSVNNTPQYNGGFRTILYSNRVHESLNQHKKACARALQISGIMSIRSLEITWSPRLQEIYEASGVASLQKKTVESPIWVSGYDVVASCS